MELDRIGSQCRAVRCGPGRAVRSRARTRRATPSPSGSMATLKDSSCGCRSTCARGWSPPACAARGAETMPPAPGARGSAGPTGGHRSSRGRSRVCHYPKNGLLKNL
jgi:hypothetical protein